MLRQRTWHSYGRKAMLISFIVLMRRAAIDLQISLNISSGQTAQILRKREGKKLYFEMLAKSVREREREDIRVQNIQNHQKHKTTIK